MNSIRVVQYGLGPIGCAAACAILEKRGLQLVGAIDIAPEKEGRDLYEILGLKGKSDIQVTSEAARVFRKKRPDVVVHTTSSFFRDVYPQLEIAAKAGVNVVSSTEELLFPYFRNPALADRLDKIARRNGSTILGTGVNPGFVMDTLALVLSGVCKEVRSVRITRRVNASTRRMPLQKKVGAGMRPEEFRSLVREGKLGHVGLLESMMLVAAGLGWTIERHSEKIEPVIAGGPIRTKYFNVSKGQVCGIHHTAAGYSDGRRVIDLDLKMYLGAKDPMDAILINGEPRLNLTIAGGVAGDVATVASLVNAIPRVVEAEAGLKTMLDLPIPRAFQAI